MAKRDKTLVRISADTLDVLCPYHGPQEVEYEAQTAPCGCIWTRLQGEEDDGLLHAIAQESAVGVAESS